MESRSARFKAYDFPAAAGLGQSMIDEGDGFGYV
jgi:hypothetical protein